MSVSWPVCGVWLFQLKQQFDRYDKILVVALVNLPSRREQGAVLGPCSAAFAVGFNSVQRIGDVIRFLKISERITPS